MTKHSLESYMDAFHTRVKKYIPSTQQWTPVDDALYTPLDLYRIPLKQAQELQLKALRFAFQHQYEHNRFYHQFCQERKISPQDIKKSDDLDKIPLVPDKFFKDYPHGKEFATWLGNIFTGKLPRIEIPHTFPTHDQVIAAFNKAGILVTFSSGTSGRHTFIPRDRRTFHASEYAAAKSLITMIYPLWEYDMFGYLLMPNPKKTNIYAGRALEIYFDVVHDVQVAIDREITTELIRMTMAGEKNLKSKLVRLVAKRQTKKMVNDIISWLETHEKTKHKIAMVGAPFILFQVMEKLREQGRRFDFGNRGAIATGGGWKVYEDNRVPVAEFRKQVKDMLGIPETNCLDVYAMVEGNGWMVHCPEGHYLHAPYSYFKPLVLDKEFHPVGYGEWGRFAFLDAAAFSYPGFIITGDKVKLLERCPVCDRSGPVLEPEVKRAQGEEIRGCAEEMRKMLSSDVGK